MNRRSFLTTSLTAACSLNVMAESRQVKKAHKYLFVIESNGLRPKHVHPENIPFRVREDRKEYKEYSLKSLPFSLEPVSDYKDNMLIVQGISGRVCGGGHSVDQGTLGSFNSRDGRFLPNPTIDHLVGKDTGKIFKNVVLGLTGTGKDIVFNTSVEAKDKPIATMCNPVAAYNRLFGAIGNKQAISKDEAIINNILANIKQSRNYLGQDKKLDIYESSLENIKNRNGLIRKKQGVVIPKLTGKYKSTDHVKQLDAHFEMAAAALKNDLTDSATISIGVGFEHFVLNFNSLKGVETPRHSLGHQCMGYENKKAHQEANIVHHYIFQLINRSLQEVQNLTVIFCSDAPEQHHSKAEEWPHVIIGNNPHLALDGRYIEFPDWLHDRHKTINALHNTILRSQGIELEHYGLLAKNVSRQSQVGVVEEIFA
ncbi:MAG: DUF1552 domain-containing protein [Lentisphaerales bacterium]|nr:DUF1552 domain-containing protein [Lentisphaerales bacterium]